MDFNRKEEMDRKKNDTLRRVTNIGYENIDFRYVQNTILYRPWMNIEKPKMDIDPETIADLVWTRAELHDRSDKVAEDMNFLIPLSYELGNDIDQIPMALSPDGASKFQHLRDVYGLKTQGSTDDTTDSLTLPRLSWLFPGITCSYFHNRPRVPWPLPSLLATQKRMKEISPYYPPVMSTHSFAYLVPNMNKEYCKQLMKAHMLYVHDAIKLSVDAQDTSGPDDHNDKIIMHVVKRTMVRITESWIGFDQQIEFLERFSLGYRHGQDKEYFRVADSVSDASMTWDAIDTKRLTDYFTKGTPLN